MESADENAALMNSYRCQRLSLKFDFYDSLISTEDLSQGWFNTNTSQIYLP